MGELSYEHRERVTEALREVLDGRYLYDTASDDEERADAVYTLDRAYTAFYRTVAMIAVETRPCGAGLDDAPMLQEVAFHLMLSARDLPEGHGRELIEGHRRQLLDLSGRILAAAHPRPTAPTPEDQP